MATALDDTPSPPIFELVSHFPIHHGQRLSKPPKPVTEVFFPNVVAGLGVSDRSPLDDIWGSAEDRFCLSCGHPQPKPVNRSLLVEVTLPLDVYDGALWKKNLKDEQKEDFERRK